MVRPCDEEERGMNIEKTPDDGISLGQRRRKVNIYEITIILDY